MKVFYSWQFLLSQDLNPWPFDSPAVKSVVTPEVGSENILERNRIFFWFEVEPLRPHFYFYGHFETIFSVISPFIEFLDLFFSDLPEISESRGRIRLLIRPFFSLSLTHSHPHTHKHKHTHTLSLSLSCCNILQWLCLIFSNINDSLWLQIKAMVTDRLSCVQLHFSKDAVLTVAKL